MTSKSFRSLFYVLSCSVEIPAFLFASDSAQSPLNQQGQGRTETINQMTSSTYQDNRNRDIPVPFQQDELEATVRGGGSKKFRYNYVGSTLKGLESGAADSLTKITLPSRIQSIGEEVFCEYEKLQEVTLKEGVTSIGKSAFDRCHNLKTVNFPKTSLRTISCNAFNGCHNLETSKLTLRPPLTRFI